MTSIAPRHLAIALVVVAIWGSNFVVMHEAVSSMPPLLFAALRFGFAALPAILFFRFPLVPVSQVALYGLFTGVGQFGLLLVALEGRIAPGVASLVMQMQVFFTVGLASLFAGERPKAGQLLSITVAAVGIVVIGFHVDAFTTPAGLALTLASSFCWGLANVVAKKAGPVNMLAYVIWSCLFAAPVLLAMSFALEGTTRIVTALAKAGPLVWAAVAWQSFANTLLGFSVWAWLLSRYPTSTVTPISFVVPLFGMAAAAIWIGEPLPGWKWAASLLILFGLGANLLAINSKPKSAIQGRSSGGENRPT